MARCPECGAPGGAAACTELYHQLLSLDYSRRDPWGPHHGVTTPCYLLQHPSWLPRGNRRQPWILLHAFLDGGLPRLRRFVDVARNANSHRNRGERAVLSRPAGTPPVPEHTPPTRFDVTIAELAVDGGFPAEGFTERARDWAEATRSGWLAHAPQP